MRVERVRQHVARPGLPIHRRGGHVEVLPGRTRQPGAQDLPILGVEAVHFARYQVRHLPPRDQSARIFQKGVQQGQAHLGGIDQGKSQGLDAGTERPLIAGWERREIRLSPRGRPELRPQEAHVVRLEDQVLDDDCLVAFEARIGREAFREVV